MEATWLPEHASQPPKRPRLSVIVDQLRGDTDDWCRSIIPLNPRQIGAPDVLKNGSDTYLPLQVVEGADSVETEWSRGRTLSLTDQSSGNVSLPRHSYHPPQTDSNQAVQRNTRKSKWAKRVRRFFSLGLFKNAARVLNGLVTG